MEPTTVSDASTGFALLFLGLTVLTLLIPCRKRKPIRGRFPDGRMYEIRGGVIRIVLEDPETARIVREKIKEFHEQMKRSQPHMFDKDGEFVGGVLKRGDENHE